jgi:CheY-like chemotaxis protein
MTRNKASAPPASEDAGTILVVDDDADTRTIFRAILVHSGFAVIESANGRDAVDQARAAMPQAVITDASIPGIDGWEPTRRLKAGHATARIPVLAVTALPPVAARAQAEEGCDAFLSKPTEPTRVVAEILRLITISRAGDAAP